jgi:hypothetical protein
MGMKHRAARHTGSPATRLEAARLALAEAERRTGTEPAQIAGSLWTTPAPRVANPPASECFSAKSIWVSVSKYCEDAR